MPRDGLAGPPPPHTQAPHTGTSTKPLEPAAQVSGGRGKGQGSLARLMVAPTAPQLFCKHQAACFQAQEQVTRAGGQTGCRQDYAACVGQEKGKAEAPPGTDFIEGNTAMELQKIICIQDQKFICFSYSTERGSAMT